MMSWLCEKRDWVAVLGGAARYDDRQIIAAHEIGRAIAQDGKHVITGGTTGVPYAAAIGAKTEGALVVGISPASNESEHMEWFRKPVDHVDLMIYTGLNVDGRSPLIVRSALAAIFIGGEFGTLNEFTSACLSGSGVLGVLEGHGGVSASIRGLLENAETNRDSAVIYETDAAQLVRKVCEEVDRRGSASRDEAVSEIGADVRATIETYLRNPAGR